MVDAESEDDAAGRRERLIAQSLRRDVTPRDALRDPRGRCADVMERGAARFFADLPESAGRVGRPAQYLATVISTAAETLERHPNFLRLLIVFAAQPPAVAGGEIADVVSRVRALAVERLQREIAVAFDDDPASSVTLRLAQFALAAFDGAFIAAQADAEITLADPLRPLAPAMIAARRALLKDRV